MYQVLPRPQERRPYETGSIYAFLRIVILTP